MAFVITSPCHNEQAAECVEVCPVDAIHEGRDMYFIDPDVCIDCAACETACPVMAIFAEEEVPEEDQKYIQLNEEMAESFT